MKKVYLNKEKQYSTDHRPSLHEGLEDGVPSQLRRFQIVSTIIWNCHEADMQAPFRKVVLLPSINISRSPDKGFFALHLLRMKEI